MEGVGERGWWEGVRETRERERVRGVCVCVCVCARARNLWILTSWRDRQTDRQTDRDTETDKQSKRQTDRDRGGGGGSGTFDACQHDCDQFFLLPFPPLEFVEFLCKRI